MAQKRSKATRRAESQAASERAAAIRAEQERAERRRRSVVVTIVVVAVLALIGGIAYAVQSSRDTTGASGAMPANMQQKYVVPAGPASAKAKVDLYEDFQCPICNELEQATRSWLPQYVAAGKVQVRYHMMSFLDRASNGHHYSSRAANAYAVVVDTAGPQVAEKFHALLYAHQPAEGSNGLTDDQLIALAVQAGASRDKITAPIKDQKFKQWVVNATNKASTDGVSGTPTVFVNGTSIPFRGAADMSTRMRGAIDAKQ
jgi:protein-disulfide isomerase